ncbi:MAG TPA: DUF4491 family protein [Candidatus Copromorpha excrementigallinarum]|uniref:DUF4491 family protein n=1 Tax=Candidatus Allocopromorpha excrementigallinarum TaxID=2840742 RepID=A0A9D1I0Y7_9FIRM|nr:DUF4491 family protein [Candidatus Copromorpha excrementigallinarum]
MEWTGIIIGAISFAAIGVFHPVVIKCEYYFGSRIWPLFLVGGAACCLISLTVSNIILSAALAVVGFAMLWSIGEIKKQEERVKKGWFPANPRRRP